MTNTPNNPPALTPQERHIMSIYDEGIVTSKHPAITPTMVQGLLHGITVGEWEAPIKDHGYIFCKKENSHQIGKVIRNADAQFIAAAPDIAREFLKLHDENQRLRTSLEIIESLTIQWHHGKTEASRDSNLINKLKQIAKDTLEVKIS